MRLAPTRFVSSADHAVELLHSLRGAGFQAAEATRVTFTVLDTIDGRLHRNGLRLVATGPGTWSLSLTDAAISRGTVMTDVLPLRASDLPEGALRDVVMAAVGERLLLAQATVVASRIEASRRRPSGVLQSLVTIDENLHLAGRRKAIASTVTVHRVPGRGKLRRRIEALCAEVGLEALSGDVVTMVVEKAGVDLSGVPRSPAPVFDDSVTALAGFREVLTHLFRAVDGNLKAATDSRDPAFVHGLRVAARRSRSVLTEGKTVVPREALTTATAGLGLLGACTGPARDLDVYLDEWDGYVASFAEETVAALGPVKALLETRRRAAYDDLAIALRSSDMKRFVRDWGKWLRKPVTSRSLSHAPDSHRDLAEFVVERIERAHLTLLENGRLITDDSPAIQVHALRRDAKRLRYLLECFGALLPAKATKQFVRRLKSLQDNLGAHQDADVHATQLAALAQHPDAQHLSETTVAATAVLVRHLQQQCHAARTEFNARFAQYDSPDTHAALIGILVVESI